MSFMVAIGQREASVVPDWGRSFLCLQCYCNLWLQCHLLDGWLYIRHVERKCAVWDECKHVEVRHVQGDWLASQWRANRRVWQGGARARLQWTRGPYSDSMRSRSCFIPCFTTIAGHRNSTAGSRVLISKFVRTVHCSCPHMLLSCTCLMSPLVQRDCEIMYACAYARKCAYVPSVCICVWGGYRTY